MASAGLWAARLGRSALVRQRSLRSVCEIKAQVSPLLALHAGSWLRSLHASAAPSSAEASTDVEPTRATELKPGILVKVEGQLWVIRNLSFAKSGKAGSYVQLDLQSLDRSRKLMYRARAADWVDRVSISRAGPYQVLYVEGDKVHVMHKTSFEQTELPLELAGEQAVFLHEGMEIDVSSYGTDVVLIHLPHSAVFTVMEAAAIRSDTRNPSNPRQVTLSNGLKIQLPPFVEPGDKVRIRIEDSSYMGKVKE